MELGSNEQHANWEAPETPAKSEAKLKELVAERVGQSFSSRLCEYITGMKPDDPRLMERLETDKKIVRAKYQLPNPYSSPSEFERALMQKAKQLDIRIKPKSECGSFFKENEFARAVHSDENHEIGIDINRSELGQYYSDLNALEHELVHGEQDKYAPRMPIELKEYEAYLANSNLDFLKENPELVDEIFFNFFIGVSTNIHYRLLSEQRGEKVIPVWDNAEYFLKKDGISPEIIAKYAKPKRKKQK